MHPVAPPSRMKPAASKSKAATSAAAQILVVDDEPDLLELLRYSLTKEGYAVQGVGSGEDAGTRRGEQTRGTAHDSAHGAAQEGAGRAGAA